MKTACLTLAVLLFPAIAVAQADGGAPYLACPALESLVVWGLIDGGEGGDTTELSAVLDTGDGRLCLDMLTGYGLVDGLFIPDCAALMGVIAVEGFDEAVWPDVPAMVQAAISGADPQACSLTLASLTLGGT
jgi:hypothetical protein